MRLPEHLKTLPLTAMLAGLAAAASVAVMAGHTAGVPAQREIAWLRHLADAGNTDAQLQLGLAYRDGRYGLVPDPRAGLHWLTAAGRGGNAYAADAAGNAYATGHGTRQDMQQALHWWQLAADGGNADAQTHLGEALLAAGGQEQGLSRLRDAADRGDQRAQADLTALYREYGLPDADLHRGENPVAALSERLDANGMKAIFTAWHTLESNTPLIEPSGDALVDLAQQGDPVAEYQLAMRYRNGAWAVERDPQQAGLWLRRSAAAGNRIAAQTLAESKHSHTADPASAAPSAARSSQRT